MRAEDALILALAVGGAAYVVAKSSESKAGGIGGVITIPVEKPIPIPIQAPIPEIKMPAINVSLPEIKLPEISIISSGKPVDIKLPEIKMPEIKIPEPPDYGMVVGEMAKAFGELFRQIRDSIKSEVKMPDVSPDNYVRKLLSEPAAYVKKAGESFYKEYTKDIPPPEEAGKRAFEGFANIARGISVLYPGGRKLTPSGEPITPKTPVDVAVENAVKGAFDYAKKAFDSFTKSIGSLFGGGAGSGIIWSPRGF